ncbi:F0F1 ATP synthase subunit B' [Algicella marina]|uniref:ATP synthase subunit b n=1 Tax=Algicella marina TaxID=2683284 RepID=A0A6P1T3X7_9RHOB|nr:F0F1 ATP synthase subunit B' [Algicella marina]QHQ35969.1 F0F1 ATP synthase subunit B' [Algicella marina]
MAEPTAGAENAAAAGPGMPQLDFSTYTNQIFWLVVTLVAIYFVLTKVALPRIGGALEDRHEAIADDLEQAAELKRRAEQAEEAYNVALATARADAQKIAADTKAEIQTELDAATAKADAEIAAKAAESDAHIAEIRASAMESVEEVANDTAIAVVEALLPGAADKAAVKSAVADTLKG